MKGIHIVQFTAITGDVVTDLSNSTITRSIAIMSISGLYEVASAISDEVGRVSLLTAVFDRPDKRPNQ